MRAIVTGALQATAADLAALEALGLTVTVHPDERAAVEDPEQHEIAVCNNLFGFHDLDAFPNLKYIQLTAAGLDRLPLARIRQKGIELRNAAGVYSIPMAEFALWGVLELYKQGRFFAENQRLHRWEKHRHLRELSGKTVLIVGCGSVGSECARRFAAFGCRCLGIARTGRQQAGFESVYPICDLPRLLPEADIVVLALALNEDTRHLFDGSMLARMKAGSILVNLSRGAIVDESALEKALDGPLSGAVLDVFETEPLPETSPLWERENLILTPHNSFVGEHNHGRMMDTVLRGLTDFLQRNR
jgi:phosphoglycerate dehydrogenase-like enzyme